jgi:hypothetical protein
MGAEEGGGMSTTTTFTGPIAVEVEERDGLPRGDRWEAHIVEVYAYGETEAEAVAELLRRLRELAVGRTADRAAYGERDG